MDLGCNTLWRLGLLGSQALLVENGVKDLLEEILKSKKAGRNATGCYWWMKSMEPKDVKASDHCDLGLRFLEHHLHSASDEG